MPDTFDDSQAPRARRGASSVDYLVVSLECDRPTAGSARYSLEGVERITIGRGDVRSAARHAERGITTLDVRVPGRSMSSSHARVVRVGAEWALEDLGSKNGSFVEGARVDRAVLDADAIVELGHTLFRVARAVPTPEGAPSDLDVRDPAGDAHVTLDPSFAERLESVAHLAPSRVPVLVLGESGTGKEVLARSIHARTGRRGSFVAVNCGAIPDALVESQLFGHVKGAFSGALRDEVGFVRAADGGTLFLDEIADLPRASQAALLRVIQEREVVPVGATRAVPVDVRLVAATHAALPDLVERGEFRRDLYARVAGTTVTLPALRDRAIDLGLLVAALLPRVAPDRASSLVLTTDAGRALLRHAWPLNVRELEQCLAASATLARDGVLGVEQLPPAVASSLDASAAPAGDDSLGDRDRALRLELLAKLAEHHGNLADVARAMGKARMQIHRWCRRFGIDPNVYRQ